MSVQDIYYRVYFDRNDEISIVCLQDFDEDDYDQERFLSSTKFDTDEDAVKFVQQIAQKNLVFKNLKIAQALLKFKSECDTVKNIFDKVQL